MLFRFKRRTVSVPLPWCARQAPQVSDRSDPASSCTSALTAERRKGQIMKYNPSETGRRIKELRRENGITQEEFADRLRITDSYLRKIESGIRSASIETLVDVAFSFHVSLDYLIVGEPASDSALQERINKAIQILNGSV